MWEVLDIAKHVAAKSRHVKIDEQALVQFSREILKGGIAVPPWDTRYHFFDGGERTVAYYLVLDSMNFCFWPPPGKPKWEIRYRGEGLSGYYALAAALTQAVESGIPLMDAEFLAGLSQDRLREILPRGELQLPTARLRILNELGTVLLTEFKGKAHVLVETAHGSAVELVRLLAQKFHSFRDVAEYQGQHVPIYKRAQIFAADLFRAFDGTRWGGFRDMDRLTAFADYKLPQVLRHRGVFHYSRELAERVDGEIFLQGGSPEEVEIRANTIWAVEGIRRELGRLGAACKAVEIDWILWNLGQDDAFRKKPYHRTVTLFY